MATLTRLEPDARPLRTVTIDSLERLSGALARRGLLATMMAPVGRMPRLNVAHPDAPDLSEEVYAWRCQDGQWWFWWAWAERICAAADVDRAADRIQRALIHPRAD